MSKLKKTTTAKNYLKFNEIGNTGKRTKIFLVENLMGHQLGKISWSGPWRKYVFSTFESQYDVGCLNEIINFINKLMDDWKESRTKKI